MAPKPSYAVALFLPLLLACTKRTNEGASATASVDAAASSASNAIATVDSGSASGSIDPAAASAAIAAITPTTPVTYRALVNKGTNMKFEVPSTWTPSQNAQSLAVRSGAPGIGVEFQPTASSIAETQDQAAMMVAVGKTLQNAKNTGPMRPAAQNGLNGFVTNGTGTKDGVAIEWMLSALGDGKGHAMLTTAYWMPDIPKPVRDELRHVLTSIAPAE